MFVFVALFLTISIADAQPLEVIWDRVGNDPDSHFGMSMRPLGDQNDDGFADWIVWSQAGDVGSESESMAQFFYGGDPPPSEPYLTILAPREAMELSNVGSLGDLNGDGFFDWYSSVRYANNLVFYIELFWGGPDYDEIPDLQFILDGYPIHNAGRRFNFNGDEYDDIYVYSFIEDRGMVLYGGAEMDTIPDWERTTPDSVIQQALPHTFGDLNNDGFDEFVSADSNVERIWIFRGASDPDTLPAITLHNYDLLRATVLSDLNNDGYDDLIILQETGLLTVHLGSEELLLEPSFEVDIPGCASLPTFHPAGDFNRDGYGDFMVVDYGCNQGWGIFYLFMGTRWHEVQHAFTIRGRTDPPFLTGIRKALGPGDVNGDGVDDIIIGATSFDAEGRRGRAVALAGDTTFTVPADHLPPTPDAFTLSAYPNPFNAQTTLEFAIPSGGSRVEIRIYNTLGQIVHSETLPAFGSTMRYFFRAEGLSSGMYVAQVTAGVHTASQKLILMR